MNHKSKMKVLVTSTVGIQLTSTVGIILMSHIDIYVTIQLDVNLMLPNLMYVYEINTRKIIFYAFLSIMAFCISGINNMTFHLIYIYYYNQLAIACKLFLLKE